MGLAAMHNLATTRQHSTRSHSWIWVKAGTSRWQVNGGFAQPGFVRRLAEPRLLMAPPSEPMREDTRPRVTHLVRMIFPELRIPVVIKRYRYRNLWQSFKEAFRRCRARRAFELAIFLQQQNIPTAMPIAAGEVRRQPWWNESYFLSEEVPHARRLRELRADPGDSLLGRRLIRAVGRTMARLHVVGLSHSDPSLSNFLVRNESSEFPELVLIDLDGLRWHRQISRRRTEKDLKLLFYRIRMTSRERLWFLAQYSRTRLAGLSARTLCAKVNLKP